MSNGILLEISAGIPPRIPLAILLEIFSRNSLGISLKYLQKFFQQFLYEFLQGFLPAFLLRFLNISRWLVFLQLLFFGVQRKLLEEFQKDFLVTSSHHECVVQSQQHSRSNFKRNSQRNLKRICSNNTKRKSKKKYWIFWRDS